ncbi:MAG: Mut7-C RNAse domain-containing protein [Thermodesulfobacteriota bacterium]
MDIRFATDCNLGTLSKWLRILGYDTLHDRGNADARFVRKAAAAGRIVLTRKRALVRLSSEARLVVVKADRARAQLGEVIESLGLEPDPAKAMTLCLKCNAMLVQIPRSEAEGRVPAYVHAKHDHFKSCPACGSIYWPGTHGRHIETFLGMHMPVRRP